MLGFLLCIDRPVGDLPGLKLNDQIELEYTARLIKEHTARLFGKAKVMKLIIFIQDSSQVHLTSFKMLSN